MSEFEPDWAMPDSSLPLAADYMQGGEADENALEEHLRTDPVTLPIAGSATVDAGTYPVRDSDFDELTLPAWTTTTFDEDFFNGVESNAFGLDTSYENVQTYYSSFQEAGLTSELYADTDSYATGVDSTDQQEIDQSLSSGTDFGFGIDGAYQHKEHDWEMTTITPLTSLTPSTSLTHLSSQSPAPASVVIPPNAAGNDCTCIVCTFTKCYKQRYKPGGYQCVITGCRYSEWWAPDMKKHVKTHYLQSDRFPCDAPGCKTISVRWSDFLRHYKSNHCSRPQKFPCDVIGCKYGGDNGFPRKDKLTSHKRNVHQGNAAPRKQPRAIKPKVQE
ncbi:MAG: hypothetical protein Q9187_007699 [Circinaria calcarea]